MILLKHLVTAIIATLMMLPNQAAAAQTAEPAAQSLASITPIDGGIGLYRPGQPIVWNIRLSRPDVDTHVSFVVRNWQGELKQQGHDSRSPSGNMQIVCR